MTGTLIRNSAPVGSTLIPFNQADMQESGANSVADALRTLPKWTTSASARGHRAGTGGAGNIVYGNSINLRGLSPFATLTLLDSHRVAPPGRPGRRWIRIPFLRS